MFPIALTVGESTNDGELIFVGTIRDITERKTREQERFRHEEILERLVSERTAELSARTEELEASHAETLRILATASEYRDDQTFEHAERVGRMAAELARVLGLSDDEQELIRAAAPLHDIGKIGVADSILLHRDDSRRPTDRRCASTPQSDTGSHPKATQMCSSSLPRSP